MALGPNDCTDRVAVTRGGKGCGWSRFGMEDAKFRFRCMDSEISISSLSGLGRQLDLQCRVRSRSGLEVSLAVSGV